MRGIGAGEGSGAECGRCEALAAELRDRQALHDEFAHLVCHALKEPLRGIHNYSGFLLEDYGSRLEGEGRERLETLVHLTRRMQGLIDSLRRFSTGDGRVLEPRPVSLQRILDEVLDSLRISLREADVEVRIAGPLPSALCDPDSVAEVFRNLIANAMTYNLSERKWIEIGFRLDGTPGSLAVFVRDNGIGIPEEHLAAVFTPFRRLHARDAFGGGSGVGLSIAKRLIELNGGRIWAESADARGTTFSFTLPEADDEKATAPSR